MRANIILVLISIQAGVLLTSCGNPSPPQSQHSNEATSNQQSTKEVKDGRISTTPPPSPAPVPIAVKQPVRKDVWSEEFRVSPGASNEGNAHTTTLSLLLPPNAKNIEVSTYTQFEREGRPWEDCRCNPPNDCAWSRFSTISQLTRADGRIEITTILKSWSGDQTRLGRLRAAYYVDE